MDYGGFWRRAVALAIDYVVICIPVMILGLAANAAFGTLVAVTPPLVSFHVDRVLERDQRVVTLDDGSERAMTAATIQRTYFGIWDNYFHVDARTTRKGSFITSVSVSYQIDPETRQRVWSNPYVGVAMNSNVITLVLLFFYYVVLESSWLQTTLGKGLMGMVVVDESGDRLSLARSFGRNLAKIVSAVLLGVGFFMAAFTARKQGLHDKIAGCLVLRGAL